MPDQTQAQAAVMEQTARRFEQVNEELEGVLNRLLQELDLLHGAWRGAGGRSFEEVRQAWAVDQRALHQALAETATAIRTAGQVYASSDADVAGRIGAAAPRAALRLPL